MTGLGRIGRKCRSGKSVPGLCTSVSTVRAGCSYRRGCALRGWLRLCWIGALVVCRRRRLLGTVIARVMCSIWQRETALLLRSLWPLHVRAAARGRRASVAREMAALALL